MNGSNDFWTGPHHFWTHFWCGLIFGAGLGGWIGWQMFDTAWAAFATLAVVGLVGRLFFAVDTVTSSGIG